MGLFLTPNILSCPFACTAWLATPGPTAPLIGFLSLQISFACSGISYTGTYTMCILLYLDSFAHCFWYSSVLLCLSVICFNKDFNGIHGGQESPQQKVLDEPRGKKEKLSPLYHITHKMQFMINHRPEM